MAEQSVDATSQHCRRVELLGSALDARDAGKQTLAVTPMEFVLGLPVKKTEKST
jgi:hypothetical protein